MNETVSGGCACGRLRYEVRREPVFAAHCHCRACQMAGGGPMTTAVAFPEGGFRLLQGSPGTYTYRGDSGLPVERAFCTDCGSPLYLKPALIPGMILVQAPSLDDPAWVAPSLHAYMGSAQPWDPSSGELPRFEKLPPRGP